MSLNNFLREGLQQQISFIKNVTRLLLNPPVIDTVNQVASLLSVLGAVSKKKVIKKSEIIFKQVPIPVPLNEPLIESVKGIGKKIGAKMRAYGISTTEDLKTFNPSVLKIPGISQNRILKWQNIV